MKDVHHMESAPVRWWLGIDPGKSSGVGIYTEHGVCTGHPVKFAFGPSLTEQFGRAMVSAGVTLRGLQDAAVEEQHMQFAKTAIKLGQNAGAWMQMIAQLAPDVRIITLKTPEWWMIGGTTSKADGLAKGRGGLVANASECTDDAIEGALIARALYLMTEGRH
jgi:hypothetical protein